MRILAFDLGDFNRPSVWHLLDTQSGEVERGQTLTTTAELTALLQDKRPDRVLCEACVMTHLLADVVRSVLPDASFAAANTNAEAWRWSQVKRKTDQADAERLVRLDLLTQLETVTLPDPQQRVLRRQLAHRQKLVSKRTSCYNAIRHACKVHEVELASGEGAWTKAGLARLDELCAGVVAGEVPACCWETAWLVELNDHVQQLHLLNAQIATATRTMEIWMKPNQGYQRLLSGPGIGAVVATAILAFIGDPHRFQNGKQVGAYAGLVPRVYQSGSSCRHGHITKSGNRLLRWLLINAAWQAVRHDPWAKATFDRICGGSRKRRTIAIVALARRLLIRSWVLLRDETTWQTAPAPLVTAA